MPTIGMSTGVLEMLSSLKFARIGLVIAEEDIYAPWYEESMRILGFDFETYSNVQDAGDSSDLIILAGHGKLPTHSKSTLESLLQSGKSVIVSGGDWGLGDQFGWEITDETSFGRAYAAPASSHHRLWPHGLNRFLFLGGSRLRWPSAESVATAQDCDVLAHLDRVTYFAPHIGQVFELIGMGGGVCCDGIGPQDGSANLIDGKLRAEDGINLYWDEDRSSPNGGHPMFADAPIDSMLDVLARCIIYHCELQGLNVYIRWQWPENAPTVACATVECETSNVELTLRAGQALWQHGMNGTFLFGGAGLKTQDAYKALKGMKHDFGLLSRGMNGAWDDDSVRLQRLTLARATGDGGLCMIRPAEGRWEGHLDFYERSVGNGIKFVSSKGGRQPGTSGYAFAFSRPAAVHGIEVTEIPYSVHTAPRQASLMHTITVVESATRHHGLIHLSFGLDNTVDADGFLHWRESLMALQGMPIRFMSARQVGEFDQVRRNVRIENRGNQLHVVSREDVEGLTLQILGSGVGVLAGEKRFSPVPEQRYGALLSPIVLDLEARMPVDVSLDPDLAA